MLNTNEFHFDVQTKTLTAEASELSDSPQHWLGRSFPVKSHHTGEVMYFEYTKTLFDYSGEDTMAWEFEPVVKLPNLQKLIIFND